MKSISRRASLGCLAATSLLTTTEDLCAATENGRVLTTNVYPWTTFAKRSGQTLERHSDALLADIASAGLGGYEPIIDSTKEFEGLGTKLEAHGLTMPSLYVNSTLHEASSVEESVFSVVSIAREAVKLGTRILVTNPSPIRWGGPENKSDSQLRCQAEALDGLGAELKALGISLAYHNHDAELREGAREFHHMLASTDAENVKFCFDAHWIFRGCGNSEVAVFDVLNLYRDRIVELHLRQSKGGIWNEAFSLEGDIDYRRLMTFLGEDGIRPHLVLEQAVEKESPNTLGVVEAHREGAGAVKDFLL